MPRTRHNKKTASKKAKAQSKKLADAQADSTPSTFSPDGHFEINHQYTRRIPKLILECFHIGMSRAEICRTLRISNNTLSKWDKEIPAVSEAIKEGLIYSQGWWEGFARMNLMNPRFNNVLWMMNMSNRFGWSRAQDGTPNPNNPVNGSTLGPVQTHFHFDRLNKDELSSVYNLIQKAKSAVG